MLRVKTLMESWGLGEAMSPAEKAKNMRLENFGFGRWGRKIPGRGNVVTHVTRGGKLLPVKKDRPDDVHTDQDDEAIQDAEAKGLKVWKKPNKHSAEGAYLAKPGADYPSHKITSDGLVEIPSPKEQVKLQVGKLGLKSKDWVNIGEHPNAKGIVRFKNRDGTGSQSVRAPEFQSVEDLQKILDSLGLPEDKSAVEKDKKNTSDNASAYRKSQDRALNKNWTGD